MSFILNYVLPNLFTISTIAWEKRIQQVQCNSVVTHSDITQFSQSVSAKVTVFHCKFFMVPSITRILVCSHQQCYNAVLVNLHSKWPQFHNLNVICVNIKFDPSKHCEHEVHTRSHVDPDHEAASIWVKDHTGPKYMWDLIRNKKATQYA